LPWCEDVTALELLKILHAARALVVAPERWTERNFAETATGKWVPVGSEHATRFNLAGALIKSAGGSVREAMTAFTKLLSDAPMELHARAWTEAQTLTRLEAVELLRYAMGRLERVVAQEQTQARGQRLGYAGSTHVGVAKVSH
jgi:hypothetical protein